MSENKGKTEKKDGASSDADEQSPAPTILSWAIRGFSLLIVVSFIGYFIWSAIRPDKQPNISFHVLEDKIELRDNGWAMPVEVTNESTLSVHALTTSATLTKSDGGTDEYSEEKSVAIRLLGPNEMVTATFWFEQNPRNAQAEFAVKTYLLP